MLGHDAHGRALYLCGHRLERPLLAIRVHAQRHRRAGAERCREIAVGRRSGVVATGFARLVGAEPVPADHDVVREVEGRVQALPRDGMIVDDEDSDGAFLPTLRMGIGRQRVLLRKRPLG